MNNTDRIKKAIENTKRIIPGYFEKTCSSRLEATAVGSYFKGIFTVEELESELVCATWTEKKHPAVAETCTGFVTTGILDGVYGLVSLEDLPDDIVLVARDDKNTGNISMVISKNDLPKSSIDETWIILGPEQGEEVVYTFHPGAPVPKSTVSSTEIKTGTKVSKKQAFENGFNLAKIEG